MKKLFILTIFLLAALSSFAQWQGITGTPQRNTSNGAIRWNFGPYGVFSVITSVDTTRTSGGAKFDPVTGILSIPKITGGGSGTYTGSNGVLLSGSDFRSDTTFNRTVANSFSKAQIQSFLTAKQNTLTFDSTPTSASTNPVTSGGIFAALAGKQPSLGFTPENVSNKATSFTTLNNTLYPTTQAVVTYVASQIPVYTSSGGVVQSGNDFRVGNGTLGGQVQWNLGGHLFAFFDGTAGKQSGLTVGNANVYAYGGDPTGTFGDLSLGAIGTVLRHVIAGSPTKQTSLDMGTGIILDNISSKGFLYSGHYEANFTANSLITKRYGDSTALAKADSAINARGFAGGFTVTAPITLSAGVLGIRTANTSQSGAISSTDWNTFNNKAPTNNPTFIGTVGLPVVTISGNLLPNVGNTYDLGASSNVMHGIYTNEAQITNGTISNLTIGTSGGSGFFINGTSSGLIQITPQANSGSWAFLLPTSAGADGTFLTSHAGAAAQTWTDIHNYAFTSPTATTQSPLTGNTTIATTKYTDDAVNATAIYFAPGTFTGSGTSGDPYAIPSSGGSVDQTANYTWTGKHIFNNSVTAASGSGIGVSFTPTLVASANNNILSALDITPTWTDGSFTGGQHLGIRMNGSGANGKVFGMLINDNVNSQNVLIGSLLDAGGTFATPGIWMTNTNTNSPTAANAVFSYDAGSGGSVFNSPGTTLPISFRINNSTKAQLTKDGYLSGQFLNKPSALTAINSTATMTAAQMATGYVTSTSAAAVTITTPTATAFASQLTSAGRGSSYYFTIDNTAGANNVTLALGSGFTQLTNVSVTNALVVPSGSAGIGTFKITFTSTTTATIARIE